MTRNVVLITIDSLRADHCGCYGYNRNTTPTLDTMAADGLVFENAIAPGPSTYESMPAVFSGTLMLEYETQTENSLNRRGDQIRHNTLSQTIPEWFHSHGYTTAAFTTNPYTGRQTNFARGFDYYEDFLGSGEGPIMRQAAHLPVLSEAKHLVTLIRGDRASKPWPTYYDQVCTWLQQTTEPYFLWIFLLDTHTPYLASTDYRQCSSLEMYYRNWKLWASKKWGINFPISQEKLRNLYDATVRSVDEFLAQLRADLSGDPVIAVHSDHGEALGEHGSYGHDGYLYEENIHVPLVIEGVEDGQVVSPTSLTVLPKILRDAASGEPIEINDTCCNRSYVRSRILGPRALSLRSERWKYIGRVDPAGDHIVGEELYDLETDPRERVDRSETHPNRLAECRAVLNRRLTHEREGKAIATAAKRVVET